LPERYTFLADGSLIEARIQPADNLRLLGATAVRYVARRDPWVVLIDGAGKIAYQSDDPAMLAQEIEKVLKRKP
jgi:hypothetical protein